MVAQYAIVVGRLIQIVDNPLIEIIDKNVFFIGQISLNILYYLCNYVST